MPLGLQDVKYVFDNSKQLLPLMDKTTTITSVAEGVLPFVRSNHLVAVTGNYSMEGVPRVALALGWNFWLWKAVFGYDRDLGLLHV